MKYVFQIFTGDLSEKSLADPKVILDKLALFHTQGNLKAVLCGWSVDKEFYRTIGEQLREWNIPMFFKTAVFSELSTMNDLDPMIDHNGDPMQPYHLNEQENFLFRCPSSKKNRKAIVDLYDEKMADLGFDGVFLDRIRYSSLIGGVEGVGGCFCEECQRTYRNRGLDVRKVKAKLRRASEEKKLELLKYDDGTWKMKDPDLDLFFRIRCEIIEDSVQYFTREFHQRGLQVGLDLFTPALGYFTGQNVINLGKMVDFIKPMLYRYTYAPAGIPFETEALRKACGEGAYQVFLAECGSMDKDSEAFVQRELKVLKKCTCNVYAGMEVNTVEPIVEITPQRVKEELRILKENNIKTMVPSWNLQKMTKECLEVLAMEVDQ